MNAQILANIAAQRDQLIAELDAMDNMIDRAELAEAGLPAVGAAEIRVHEAGDVVLARW